MLVVASHFYVQKRKKIEKCFIASCIMLPFISLWTVALTLMSTIDWTCRLTYMWLLNCIVT